MDHATRARRDREFEQCNNKHQVDQLMDRWAVEDAQALLAEKSERQQLVDLRRRVAQLERVVAALPAALGQVLGKTMKNQIGMQYGGVHDINLSYRPNTLVTTGGSLWLALTEVEKGQRPGRAPGWKLIAKAGSAPEGTFS